MKLLELSDGTFTQVDDEVFEDVSTFIWRKDKLANHVVRTVGPHNKRRLIRLHRHIMKAEVGQVVDHIDGNVLNNIKSNLRIADKSTNGMNRGKQRNNTSGYKGVTFHKQSGKWAARIKSRDKHLHLGLFIKKEDAAKAYNEAALRLHGEFAKINAI